MVICCVPGCASTDAEPELNFFRVPLNYGSRRCQPDLANFVIAMTKSQKNVDSKSPIQSAHSLSICAKHFNPEDICVYGTSKVLKLGALPCRNLPLDMLRVLPIKEPPHKLNTSTFKAADVKHQCNIPGCSSQILTEVRSTGVHYKYKCFTMKNPKFTKTDQSRREWLTKVYEFLMKLTDGKIAASYHRDQVKVCERHFAAADLSYVQGTGSKSIIKILRIGAMPSLHLPDPSDLEKNSATKNSAPLRPQPEKNSEIKHKSFASLSASARKMNGKTWEISTKNSILQCVKSGLNNYDQKEIVLQIDKAFDIGLVYYGWCLPKEHFATSFDVCRHGIVKYLDYLDSLTPCEGVITTSNVKKYEEVVDHYCTISSEPFEYKPAMAKSLLKRSIECDVLLPAPSYGSCKSCTIVSNNLKKAEKKEECCPISLEEDKEDSITCGRLKKELRQKNEEMKVLGTKLHQTMKIAQNQRNTISQVQDQLDCKIIQLKRTTSNQEIQNEDDFNSIASNLKLLTKEEYMQPILKFTEQHNLPQTFPMFWQFQVDMLWNNMDSLNNIRLKRYPAEIMDIFADIYMKGAPAYNLIRSLKLMKMPSITCIKDHSVRRHADMVKRKDEELMRSGKEAPNIPVVPTCQEANEHPQEVNDEQQSTTSEGKLLFALRDDSITTTACDEIFTSTYGAKRKLPPVDFDISCAKMSKSDKNCISESDQLSDDAPDLVIEVSTDLPPDATEYNEDDELS